MSGSPLDFLQTREHHASKHNWNPSFTSTSFLSNRLDIAHNLYRRDLFAHFGCVNAIEFSQDGCWLISGGDDRRVLLWNLENSMSKDFKPLAMKEEHSSNIFCLSFDSANSKIFSAGNDESVIVHDVRTGEAVNVFMHEEAIYGVSVNPYVDSVFASAGEDGQILIFDIRVPSFVDPLLLARSYDAFHAVQFHPIEPMFVVTANSKEGVALWDVRKPRVPFVKYGEKRSSESSMCARFNSDGSQIIALRRRMHPVLFNTHSSSPACEFDADHYYNSCTMKSCCFAGSRDQFVLSGSDDFSLYMWRIPDPNSKVTFIPEAHLVLKGHRSIVNQVRFNVHNFNIASSGVEKIVKLWSPISVPGSCGAISNEEADSNMTRRVYTHEDYIGLVLDSGQTVSHDYSHGNTDEDPKMMAFFDSLVQREVEGWTTNTDLSDDDDDDEDEIGRPSLLSSSSQSDVDSDSAWASPEPRMMMFSPLRRLRPPRTTSSRTSTNNSSRRSDDERTAADGEPGAVGEEGRRRKPPAQGSEWILKLIAKKRAQLKAAKKRAQLKAAAKKKRNVKKKHKSKARQFIQCFTSSRQYLYRPEHNRATTSNGSNRAAPADLLRRRHTVAPYTMMSLGHFEEEDDEETSESEEEEEEEEEEDGNETNNNAEKNNTAFLSNERRQPPLMVGPSVHEEEISSSSSMVLSTPGASSGIGKDPSEIGLWSSESSGVETEEDEGQTPPNITTTPSSSPLCPATLNGIPLLVESENTKGAHSNSNSVNSTLRLRSGELASSRRRKLSHLRVSSKRGGGGGEDSEGWVCVSPSRSGDNDNEDPDREEESDAPVLPISEISTDERGTILFVSGDLGLVNGSSPGDEVERGITSTSGRDVAATSSRELCVSFTPNCGFASEELQHSNGRNHLRKRRSQAASLRKRRLSEEISTPRSPSSHLSKKRPPKDLQQQQTPSSPDADEDDSLGGDEGTSGPTYGLSVNTPDSGICLGERGVEDSPSELEGKERKPRFRKRKISDLRMKSYRSRGGDDEGDEADRP